MRFFRDLPTRFAVVPRRGGTGDVRWFEADPTYVLHWINAYEDGDEIVLDGFFQHDPSPRRDAGRAQFEQMFRFLDLERLQARPHRWRFNLRTGQTKEEPLDDRILEFGMINGALRRAARTATPTPSPASRAGSCSTASSSSTSTPARSTSTAFRDGVFASEAPFAPRVGATGEDDGYLRHLHDRHERRPVECLVFAAQDLAAGPIARVRLPERICSGTHGCWCHLVARPLGHPRP